MSEYLAPLLSMEISGFAFWLIIALAVFGLIHAWAAVNKRHCIDNGMAYSGGKLSFLSGPIAWLSLVMIILSTNWAGDHSLVLSAFVFAASLTLGDTLARNYGVMMGFTQGTGINAIKGHARKEFLIGIGLWLFCGLTGLFNIPAAIIAAFVLPILATRRAVTMTAQQQAAFAQAHSILAVVLAVTERAIEPGDFTGDLQNGIDIHRVPAAAALKRDDIESRLEQVCPTLTVDICDPSHITLVPVTPEIEARRRMACENGGMIAEITDTAPSTGSTALPHFGVPNLGTPSTGTGSTVASNETFEW